MKLVTKVTTLVRLVAWSIWTLTRLGVNSALTRYHLQPSGLGDCHFIGFEVPCYFLVIEVMWAHDNVL